MKRRLFEKTKRKEGRVEKRKKAGEGGREIADSVEVGGTNGRNRTEKKKKRTRSL